MRRRGEQHLSDACIPTTLPTACLQKKVITDVPCHDGTLRHTGPQNVFPAHSCNTNHTRPTHSEKWMPAPFTTQHEGRATLYTAYVLFNKADPWLHSFTKQQISVTKGVSHQAWWQALRLRNLIKSRAIQAANVHPNVGIDAWRATRLVVKVRYWCMAAHSTTSVLPLNVADLVAQGVIGWGSLRSIACGTARTGEFKKRRLGSNKER
eukprot:1156235-Pelagomonas_calceolata.AAC.25